MKVKPHRLENKERIETLDALYTAASTLKGRQAIKLFLRDLLTPGERIMLGRRILIAQRLLASESVRSIADTMHVGCDTVYRVQRWLEDQLPGYEEAIKGMEKEFVQRKQKHEDKKRYATSALYRLKRKYPLHFLLIPAPESKK
ncbi:MAG: hypothetical protein KGI70_01680 [Patescibacteria group bacterium]|nr:hypothetical protein [Patescibacteria group bacterium]